MEVLKRYGWSGGEIRSMTPAQRRSEFEEATDIDEREQAARDAASAAGLLRPEDGGALPLEGGSVLPRRYLPREELLPQRYRIRPQLVGHLGGKIRRDPSKALQGLA
jgi:hypothetical protein